MHYDHSPQKLTTSPGAHTCLLFDSLEDYKNQADKYILDGLKNNKKCICALDEYSVSELKTRLKAWGFNVDKLEKSGQLMLENGFDFYCPGKRFEPEKTIRRIQKETLEAKRQGFEGLQGLGEPTFDLGDSRAGEKLPDYEKLINSELVSKYDFTALCVYNKNRHAPETIKEVVKLHPQLLHNSRFYPENTYYLPPQSFAGQDRNEQEIKCWLQILEKNNRFIRDMNGNRIQIRQNLHEVRRLKKELKAIINCTKYLLEATDYKEAVRRIFDSCLEVLGCQAGYMAVCTGNYHALQAMIGRVQKNGFSLPFAQSIPLRGLMAKSFETGSPIWENCPGPEGHDHPFFGTTQDLKNIIYIPLCRHNTKLGIIAAANRDVGFGRTEAKLAESFAPIASLALASRDIMVTAHTNDSG